MNRYKVVYREGIVAPVDPESDALTCSSGFECDGYEHSQGAYQFVNRAPREVVATVETDVVAFITKMTPRRL